MQPDKIKRAAEEMNFDAMARPLGVRWSEMLLGRKACREAAKTRGRFVVSAYDTKDGRRFYTDPVAPESRPGPGVLYRIRITMKVPQ